MGCGASSSNAAAPAASSSPAAPVPAAAPTQPDKEKQSLVWIAGQTCAGKTFLGDYLATRGYHHIDGDFGNQSADPKVKELWANLFKAIGDFKNEGAANEADWKPYYQLLVNMFNEAAKTGQNVVLSFAILNLFSEKDWIAESIPGIQFFKVDVENEIILERALVRNKQIVELSGTTPEAIWATPQMEETRKKYGEEFTDEGFRECYKAELFSLNYIVCEPTDDWITYLPNNDLESFQGIKKLNEILDLEWVEVDTDAVAQVNYERMKNIDLSLPT